MLLISRGCRLHTKVKISDIIFYIDTWAQIAVKNVQHHQFLWYSRFPILHSRCFMSRTLFVTTPPGCQSSTCRWTLSRCRSAFATCTQASSVATDQLSSLRDSRVFQFETRSPLQLGSESRFSRSSDPTSRSRTQAPRSTFAGMSRDLYWPQPRHVVHPAGLAPTPSSALWPRCPQSFQTRPWPTSSRRSDSTIRGSSGSISSFLMMTIETVAPLWFRPSSEPGINRQRHHRHTPPPHSGQFLAKMCKQY